MNFIDAIKTGLPFKRKHWPNWVKTHWKTILKTGVGPAKYATKEDIVAEDWETLTPKPKNKCCCCRCDCHDLEEQR